MDFALPQDLVDYLAELDAFIEKEIRPLEQQDDNIRFFDHRREWARTDFDNGGLPRHEWEALLGEAQRRADKAGHWRFSAPKKYGGKDGSNLWMAVILFNNEPMQGGGEPAIICMGAVIANAIADATGARLYHLPMTPERVMEALRKKQESR